MPTHTHTLSMGGERVCGEGGGAINNSRSQPNLLQLICKGPFRIT